MTVETKIHIVRVALWIASIFVVTWPLHLARPVIGDIAYVASCAIVFGGFYWLGIVITKRMGRARQVPQP